MSRFSFVLAASLVAVVVLAACSGSIAAPASPSAPPASPSAAPTDSPKPSVTPLPSVTPPPATPAPTEPPQVATPRPATPRPTAPTFTDEEQRFLAGVQRGMKDCLPVRGSDLPGDALLGIECGSTDPAIAQMGFYLFASDQGMLDAYLSRMNAEGIELDSGSCFDGEAEHAYVPGEGLILERAGCFLNDKGFANYRYTVPGDHVYVGLLGNSADMLALENFAWIGNQDTPGNPTLWGEPS